MKKLTACFFALLLSACTTFQPHEGMKFEEFRRHAGASGKGGPEIIGMNQGISVYRLNGLTDKNIFYWFENVSLVKISQGELPVIRQQIEVINR